MADSLEIKAPSIGQDINISVHGMDVLKNVIRTLEQLSEGTQLHNYWTTQEELVRRVTSAYKEFNQTASSSSAVELVSNINALKAVAGGDIAGLFKNFEGMQAGIERAVEMVGRSVNGLTTANFKDAFAAFETLKDLGVDTSDLFQRLTTSTDTRALQAAFQSVNDQLVISKRRVRALREELDNLKSSSGIKEKEKEIDNLRATIDDVRSVAEGEFREFLRGHGIEDDGWRFSSYFDDIRNGTQTAVEAIRKFKLEYGYLFEELRNQGVDTSQVDLVIERMEEAIIKVENLASEMRNISSSIRPSDIASALSQSENLTEEQRASMAALAQEGTELKSILPILAELINATAQAEQNTGSTLNSLTQLVSTIRELGTVSEPALSSMSGIFKSLGKIDKLSVNAASIKNIVNAVKDISSFGNVPNLNIVSNVDFTGFKDLHISKASLRNLAEYLPQIAAVNASRLDRLSKINLTNFNNVRVNKSSMEAIAQLNEALKELSRTKVAVAQSTGTGISIDAVTSSANPIGATKQQIASTIADQTEVAYAEWARIQQEQQRVHDETAASWNNVANAAEREERRIERATQKEIEAYYKAEQAREASIERTNEKAMAAKEAEISKSKDAAFKELEARQQADMQIRSEIARGHAEFDAKIRAEEEAVERATQKEIEAYYKAEQAKTDSAGSKGYSQAVKTIKEYYSLLTEVQQKNTDISINNGVYSSVSGKWDALAQSLNNTSISLRELLGVENVSKLSEEEQIGLTEELTAAKNRYLKKIEELRNKQSTSNSNNEAKRERERQSVLKRSEALLQKLIKAEKDWTAAKNGKSASSYTAIKADRQELERLISSYQQGEITTDEFKSRLQSLDIEFTKNATEIRSSGEATKTWGERLRGLASKFSTWFSITRVIMAAVRTTKEMISTSIELDEAMTQMKIVTRASSEELERFGRSAVDAAKDTATSVADIMSSATTYARLGYDMDDSTNFAKYTAMLQNVGNIDVQDAQNALTSIIKAFDVDADKIEEVMDKLVITGNNFPISVSEIAEGMTNASSTLEASGNTLEQTIALLTAANTTIQNASKSSTGLRTIAARIRNTKTELDELGEVMTEANYEELVSNLTEAGVHLTDINGEYRSTYDIMADIAAKWGEMNSMQQAAMATALSGTRQQAVFYSIINNFKEAADSMESMSNSAGSLQEAFADYMNTAKAHIQNFKNAFAALATSIFDSGLLNFFIDIATALVNGISTVTGWIENLGGLKTVLLGVATALLLVKGGLIAYKIQMIAVAAWQKILTFFTAIKNGIMNIVNIIPNAITAWKAYAAGTATASTAMQASIPIIGLVLAALTALTAGMALASSQTEETADDVSSKLDEANQRAKELASAARTTTEELSKLAVEYINANNQLDGLTGTTNKYVTATDNLRKGLKIEQSEIQNLIDKYGDYDAALRAATLNKLKTDAVDLKGGVDAAFSDLDKAHTSDVVSGDIFHIDTMGDNIQQEVRDAIDAIDGMSADLKLRVDWAMDEHMVDNGDGTFTLKSFYVSVPTPTAEEQAAYGGYNNAYMIKQYKAYQEALTVLADTVGTENYLYEQIYESYSQIKQPAEEVIASIEALNENLITQYLLENDIGKTVPKTAEEFEAFRDKLVKGAVASGKFYGTQEDIKGAIDNILSSSSDYAQFYNNVADVIAKFESRAEKLNEELDKLQDTFSSLKALQDNYNENGFFSTDDLQKLLSLTPEYLNLLIDESGQLDLSSEAYKRYIAIKAKALVLDQVKALYESILSMTAEEAQAYANAAAYDEQTDSLEDLIVATTQYYTMLAKQKDLESNSTVYTDALKKSLNTVSMYASVYDSWLNSLSSSTNEFTGKTEENTDALKKQKEALEEQKKGLEDSKKALEKYKTELTNAQSAIKSLIETVSEYIKAQKEAEKKNLEERKNDFDELIDKEKEELRVKKEAADFEKTLKEKHNTHAKNSLSVSIAALDDSAAGKKSLKKAQDDLSKSREDLQETLSDHEYDIRVAALDKLKEANDKYYDDEINKISDYLGNTRKLYEDACGLIENDTGDLYGKLWKYTYEHTTKTKAEFDHMWNEAKDALNRYGVSQLGVIGVMETLQGEIYNVESDINNLSGAIDDLSGHIQNLADNGIGSVQSKIGAVREEYKKLLDLINGVDEPKWYYWWQGQKIESKYADKDRAIQDIIRRIEGMYGGVFPAAAATVYGTIQHYASGTNNASGGVSLVGERGAELRVLNRGDGILSNKIVRGLTALGTNPAQFLAEAGQKMLATLFGNRMKSNFGIINKDSTISPSISIVVQGDATQSTLNALEVYAKKISDDTIRRIQSETLRRTYSSRVR